MKNSTKTYSEMLRYSSYEDRLKYLQVFGAVGDETFGSKRYLNQGFYTSDEWKRIRRSVIVRDCGCDLAIPKLELHRGIIVHHIMPISEEDIIEGNPIILDPENLVCVSKYSHDFIHYGNSHPFSLLEDRRPNDTVPWR